MSILAIALMTTLLVALYTMPANSNDDIEPLN
jgi:hypothetical protein